MPVVRAEARDVLAERAQGLAEIGRRGIVRLEAEEDLAAPEEVHRIVIERAMLEQEGLGVRGAGLARGAAIEMQRLADLPQRVAATVGPDALPQQLAREPPARDAGSRVEVPDPLLPVLVEGVHQVGHPAASSFQESHPQRREAIEQPLEHAGRERHLHLVPVAEDVRQDERVDLLGDARRQVDARRAVHPDGDVQLDGGGENRMEVRMTEMLRQAHRRKRVRRGGVRHGQTRRQVNADQPELLDASPDLSHRLADVGERDESDGEEPSAPRAAVVGDVAVVGPHAGDRELGIENGLEGERHRAVEHLRVDAFPVHVLDADAVEDAADRGLGMEGRERALPRPVGLREHALELRPAGARIEIANHEPRLPVAIGAR